MSIKKLAKFIPDVDGSEQGGGIHHWSQKNNKPEMAEVIFKESLLDIWLLSRCEFLLYMDNSTFSTIAVTLHNKKVVSWNKPQIL